MPKTTSIDSQALRAALRIGGATALAFLALISVWASVRPAAAEGNLCAGREQMRQALEQRFAEAPVAALDGIGPRTCLDATARLVAPAAVALKASDAGAERQPWGVQLAGSFSESRALAIYRGLQKRYPSVLRGRAPLILRKPNPSFGPRPMVHIRIAAPTREAANDLCQRLRAERGACVVLRN